jgi:2-polyprenyl-3-methyl-5-hydroxy-6-metoxy-1,4-benzoquinol methylase
VPKRLGELLGGPLKRVPGLKSAYYLAMSLRQMAADQWRSARSFDTIFLESEDPWESASPKEVERFGLTLAMLAAAGKQKFERAVEIGCAEGIFTQRIAPFCAHLDALDYSEVALARARKRTGSPHVNFRKWDMRKDSLDVGYDLVIAMGVITSLYRPSDVKRVCSHMVAALQPGGFLLFSDVRQSRVFENAWWGRLVLRGGEQIRRLLGRRADLDTLATADTGSHVFALFRKAGSA